MMRLNTAAKFSVLLLLLAGSLLANVGTLLSVKGDVTITRGGERLAAIEEMILEEKDTIETAADSGARAEFSDGTIVSVGAASSLNVEEFLYEESGNNNSVKFSLGQGVFRSISGSIAKANPEKFVIKTPTSTVGIRGTDLFIESQETQTVLSSIDSANAGTGILSNTMGTVDVGAGFQSIAAVGFAPTIPVAIPAATFILIKGVEAITSAAAGSAGGAGAGAGSASAGAGTAAGVSTTAVAAGAAAVGVGAVAASNSSSDSDSGSSSSTTSSDDSSSSSSDSDSTTTYTSTGDSKIVSILNYYPEEYCNIIIAESSSTSQYYHWSSSTMGCSDFGLSTDYSYSYPDAILTPTISEGDNYCAEYDFSTNPGSASGACYFEYSYDTTY